MDSYIKCILVLPVHFAIITDTCVCNIKYNNNSQGMPSFNTTIHILHLVHVVGHMLLGDTFLDS